MRRKVLGVVPAALLLLLAGIFAGARADGSIDAGVFSAEWKQYGDVLQVTMSCTCTGWLAIGWSATAAHVNADVIVGWVSGSTVVLSDAHVNGKVQPTADAAQNVVLVSGSEASGVTTITFNRSLTTTDTSTDDLAITDTSFRLMWAIHSTNDGTGSASSITLDKHTSRGSASVNFLKTCDAPPTLVNPDVLLYDNCLNMDSAYGVRVRWSVLPTYIAFQIQADVAADNGYVAVGVRKTTYAAFPAYPADPEPHEIMKDNNADFMDVWAVGTTAGVYDLNMHRTDGQVDTTNNLLARSFSSSGSTLKGKFNKTKTVSDATQDHAIDPATDVFFYYACRLSGFLDGSNLLRHQAVDLCRGELRLKFDSKYVCTDDYAPGVCNDTVIDGGDGGGSGGGDSGNGGSPPSGNSYTLGSVTLEWTIDGEFIEFKVYGSITGWIGVAISPSKTHTNSEMYVAWVGSDGNAVVNSYTSSSKDTPSLLDSTFITDIVGSETGGVTTISYRRPLAGSGGHKTIEDAVYTIGLAYHSSEDASPSFNQHTNQVQFAANLLTGGLATIEEPAVDVALGYFLIVAALPTLYAIFYWTRQLGKSVRPVNFAKDPEAGELKNLHGEAISSAKFAIRSRAKGDATPAPSYVSRVLHYRIPRYQFDVKDAVIFGFIALTNMIALKVAQGYEYDLGIITGQLVAANVVFVVTLGTRSSALVWILHFPFDHAISFHRWMGRIVVALSIIHLTQYYTLYEDYTTGVVAIACLFFLFLTSLGPVRRKFFNAFYYSHFSFFGFIICAAMHAELFKKWAIAAAVIYGVDRLIRLIYGIVPRKTFSMKSYGDMTRVKFTGNWFSQYELGQYVFVSFPAINPLEFHPFTLASGPDEPYKEVCIKGLGDFTSKLKKHADTGVAITIRVDGPYGKWPFNVLRYKTVVVVSGGVGVTPCIAMLRHLYRFNCKEDVFQPHLANFYFVWVVKNRKEYEVFQEEIEHAKAKAQDGRYPMLHLMIYLTGEKDVSPDSGFIGGRPNFEKVFLDVEQSFTADHRRAAVVSCGPAKMVDSVWDECVKRTKGKTRYDFHHETFEF